MLIVDIVVMSLYIISMQPSRQKPLPKKDNAQLSMLSLEAKPQNINDVIPATKKPIPRAIMYSQLSASTMRGYGRISRRSNNSSNERQQQASTTPSSTNAGGFADDISFDLFHDDQPKAQQIHKTTLPQTNQKFKRSTDHIRQQFSSPNWALPKPNKKLFLILGASIIILAGLYAGGRYISSNRAKARQASQAQADWKRADAQWQCTLKQYELRQHTGVSAVQNNKETSCVK